MDKDYFRTTRYYIKEENQYLFLLRIGYVDNWQTAFGLQKGFVISYYHISPYDCIINNAMSCCSSLPNLSNFAELNSDIPIECLRELNNFQELLAIKTGSIKEVTHDTGYLINVIAQSGRLRDKSPVLFKNYSKCGGTPVIINHRIDGQYECIDLGFFSTRLQIYDTNDLPNYYYNISKEDYEEIKNVFLFYMLKIYAKLALAYTDKLTIRPII